MLQIKLIVRFLKKVFKEENQVEHALSPTVKSPIPSMATEAWGRGNVFMGVFLPLTSQQIFTSALWMPLVLIF